MTVFYVVGANDQTAETWLRREPDPFLSVDPSTTQHVVLTGSMGDHNEQELYAEVQEFVGAGEFTTKQIRQALREASYDAEEAIALLLDGERDS